MDSDHPLKPGAKDRLGFQPLAEKLAHLITNQSSKDGLVLGIEGEWGSGKSSLLSLIAEEIEPNNKNKREIGVLNFAPWLIGDRDNLITQFLGELAKKVEELSSGDSANTAESDPEKLIKNLKRYAILASSIGAGAKLAGHLIPGVGLIGEISDQFKTLFENQEKASELEIPALEEQRDLVTDQLARVSFQLVVIIDDLDRLEPKEASEVLRLIKAVADFPNIVYVLAYDPKIVGHLLQKGLKVKNGKDYLEKIVQVSFRIPRPEGFDLRNWLKDEVRVLFPEILKENQQSPSELRSEVNSMIDEYGGQYLKTPRHVVRTLNAIKLHAIHVKDDIYLPDMIFLQLIKLGNPELYEWIEEYLTRLEARSWDTHEHYRLSEPLATRLQKIMEKELELDNLGMSLSEADSDEDITFPVTLSIKLKHFEKIMPGIKWNSSKKKVELFSLSDEKLSLYIANSRLGSPEHYRLYFAMSIPAGALSDREVADFISLAEKGPQEAGKQLTDYARKERPQGGTMAEVLLDRLKAQADQIPEDALCNILKAMGENIDDMERQSIEERRTYGNISDPAERLAIQLMKRLPFNSKETCLKELFEQGKSLGWLTQFFRDEIFRHGLLEDIEEFKGRKRPEDEWLFNAPDFEQIRQIMLQRYRSTKPNILLNVPTPISLLFGWKQGSDNPNEVSEWVEKQIKTDKGLLDFLKCVRSSGTSTQNGETSQYYSLKSSNLGHFMDMDKVIQRLENLNMNQKNSEQAAMASELLEAFEYGDR